MTNNNLQKKSDKCPALHFNALSKRTKAQSGIDNRFVIIPD